MSSAADPPPRGAEAPITVEQALRMPCLAGATLVAGARGVGCEIRGVNVMDDIDIVRWMQGGELLLSTGYSVRDDPSALCRLVQPLADRGLAALAIKLGLYLDELPPDLQASADRAGLPIITLPPTMMFSDILSELLSSILNRQAVELERSAAIHSRLTAVAAAGGSLQELAVAVAELVQRPVAIRDGNGQTLAGIDDVPTGAEASYVTRPIMIGNVEQGQIVMWTEGTEDAQPHQLRTMEQAATVAAMAMAQQRAVLFSERRHRTLLLMQLVSRRPPDRAEIARWAAAMGWDLVAPRAVVLIELENAGAPLRVAGQPLEDQLIRVVQEASGTGAIIWGLETGLALLVEPGRSLGRVCCLIHAAVHRALEGVSVMVAAGRVYDDPGKLQRSHEEALSALSLGRDLRGRDFVVEHEELGVYRLLSRLETAELRRHRDETLARLLEYDRAHSGSLVETLEAFLRCDYNRVHTAAQLFIHYNTLRYRLAQIDRLTDDARRDPTSRLNLELAVCAHRLLMGRGAA